VGVNPADFTAIEAARRLRNGTLTAAELMEACIDRITTLDPALNAFVYIDRDSAMRAAQELDGRPASAPLHGLPLGVKDVLDTADMPTGYGSPIWQGYRPRADSVAVSLAKSAGAIVLGKTATTEFATRKPGATANPRNPAHTPGGSSSGSAAAVSAALCPIAFGTQTAGSIIRPAAFCGIVGYKPSFGAIHRGGMKVMSESLDTIGVLARSVADCALFVGAVTGRDLGDPDQLPEKMPKLGLVLSPGDLASPDTLERLHDVSDTLRRGGASVTEVRLPTEASDAFAAHPVVMNMEIAQALSWELRGSRGLMSQDLLEPIRWAQALAPSALDAARKTFVVARRAFAAWIKDFDAVITPSATGEAPLGLANTGSPTFNILWTALHTPCVTVPAGNGPLGLPLGIQIVCAEGQDRSALQWARWVQSRIS
jgi:Asp-tRNA(Asn)/Glu-tRNA(Gln) amidotransferase A subunit family amidase